jgi:tetratricopeptide (TPR) repeat protein
MAVDAPLRRGAVARYRVRVLWALILLIPLCGLVGIACLATRGAGAQSAEPILGCALLQGQPAVDACDEAMRSRLPDEIRAEAAYKKGVELGELMRYGDAVKAYGAAIRLKPDYAAAYTNLGFSLSRLERWQEARLAYENAIRLTPDDVDAHYNLGVALVMLGRSGAALREFRETVALTPMDADAHYNMGLALNSLGRHAEAMQAYHEAVRMRSDYADAWGNLGLTANLIGQYRESAEAFERAEALVPAYFDSRPRQREAFEASRGGRSLYRSVVSPR